MAFDVGSAVGYLLLDTSKWESGLKSAKMGLNTFQDETATAADKFTAMGTSLGSVGKTLTLGVTAPLVGMGATAVKTAADFEAAMSNVRAISGASADEMEALTAKAEEMGAKTKFSATEAADAFSYMAMAGWDTESMLAGIEGIMSLAAASGEDLATTSDIVTDALTAFGLTAEDTSMFVDVLAAASSASNTNVSMLGESFKYVAPVAGTFGYSVQDVGAALGLMANSGIKASQAGTSFRSALTRMIKPTDTAMVSMENLGLASDGVVTAMVNADGSMKPLRETLSILREQFSTLNEAEQAQAAATIFGQESMAGMLAIINASDSDFEGLISTMDEASGTAQEMADTQLDNLNGQLTILKSGLEGAAIAFGNLLMPMIKDITALIQKLVDWVNGLNDGQKQVVVIIAEVAAAIGPLLIIVGKVSGLIGKLIPLISGAGGLSGVLTALTGPVGIVIAAVVALAAAWATNFGEIRDKAQEIMNAIGTIISSVLGFIKGMWESNFIGIQTITSDVFAIIQQLFSDTLTIITDIFNVFAALFSGDWSALWDAVKTLVSDIWTAIGNLVDNALNLIVDIIGDIATTLYNTAKDVFNKVEEAFQSVWKMITDWFNEAINDPVNTVKSIGTALLDAGKSIFTSLWDGMKSVWTSISDWVSEKINWLKDKIKFWESENSKMDASTVTVTTSSSGGSFASGLDYVPRDMNVRVHEGERILTKQENASGMFNNGGSGGVQTVNFDLSIPMDGQVLARAQYSYNLKEGSLRGGDLVEGGNNL